VVATAALLHFQNPAAPPPGVEAGGDDAIAAGGRVGGGFVGQVEESLFRVRNAWDAAGKLRQAQKENDELKEWKELALALSERMERYEALLKMPPEALGQGEDVDNAISARLILDAGGPFKRTLLANAGADHGVKLGYVALNENGLIGRVVAVGHRSARILLVDDYNSRVPVMGESSRARALLVGRAGQKPRLETGLTLETPQLQFVVGAGGLRQGERIVTSGDGGIYPRGILVGWADDAGGVWRAKLGAAREPIDFVRLIPYVNPEEPEAAPVKQGPLPPAPEALIPAGAPETPAPARRLAPLPPPLPPPPPGQAGGETPPPESGPVE
jgi:rod shape-determining protein MreC